MPPVTQNSEGNMKKFKKILQIIRFIAIFVIKKDTIIRSSITKKLTKLAAAAIHGRPLPIAAANAAPVLIVPAVPNKKYKRSLNGILGDTLEPLKKEYRRAVGE